MLVTLAFSIPGGAAFVALIESGLNFLANATHSAGLAIIIFTILIKLLLTPLTVKSLRSSRAMQDLQPKIKAMQKRYGNDRQKISAETMRLYQEHKVNPMAGCFPMLLQIPVFIGLYQAIRGLSTQGVGEFAQPFLWLPTLAHPDPLHVLPIVAAIFQLIQTRMSLPTGNMKSDDPQQKMMAQMMQFMPFTVIIFGWNFASGLVLYWATQAIFSAVQQYFITGWGSLREWLPFLPEVVRYTPPPDIEEDKVIVTGSGDGEDRPAPSGGGLWGLINRQIQKVETQQSQARDAASDAATADGDGPARGGSRIIVTNSGGAGANGNAAGTTNAGKAAAPSGQGRQGRSRAVAPNGSTASPSAAGQGEVGGPVVPRKNRNRR